MTLFDHLWQSTLIALLVYALTLLFRRQSARVRYGLWLAASLKFLLPFSLLAALGRMAFVHTVPAGSMRVFTSMRPVVLPFSAAAPAPDHLPWLGLLTAVWVIGATIIAGVWLLRWVRLWTIAHAGRPLALAVPVPVRATSALLEPGLVGIWRPVILLPEGIFSQLSHSEIDAILGHELCHWRRRDNLLAALHMLVEAIFWFHPLVWFIGARLVEEREAACDESVLAGGQNPLEYAQAILRVCRFYLRSPLPCAAGVAGADLGRRVDAIMARRELEDMDAARKLLLTGLLLATLLVPLAAGSLRFAPPAQLVRRLAASLLPPAPTLAARPVAIAPPHDQAARKHSAAIRPQEPFLQVEARRIQEPALPAAPPVIFVPSPQLPAESQQDETQVCRAPQQLPNSRLIGPQVCLPQREWDQLKQRDLVLMPDGQTLNVYYEKDRSKMSDACHPRAFGTVVSSVTFPGACF
ncbi:MAG: M48 family metalloprotease [Alphaproteobacteria bacterium]|nr:M48 family metalloprotease [Alphaproteobacteria bacterium]